MFQAKQRGWRHLAASLMLLPGLTAVGAEVLHLMGTAGAQERKYDGRGMQAVKPTNEDPRMLVRRAKEALDSGRLDNALDLARQAEANGRSVEWKLFEDTPESILKDVVKAIGRRDKARSEKLIAQARALTEAAAATPEQRMLNLEKARGMCLEAIQLHGPYSMWHFGDKPESLLKEIDLARVRFGAVTPSQGSDLRAGNTNANPPKVNGTSPTSPRPNPMLAKGPKKEELYVPPPGWDHSQPAPKGTAVANNAPKDPEPTGPRLEVANGGKAFDPFNPPLTLPNEQPPAVDEFTLPGTVVSKPTNKSQGVARNPNMPAPKANDIVQARQTEPALPIPEPDATPKVVKIDAPMPEVTPKPVNNDAPGHLLDLTPKVVKNGLPVPMAEVLPPPAVAKKDAPIDPTASFPMPKDEPIASFPMAKDEPIASFRMPKDETPVVKAPPSSEEMPRLVPPKEGPKEVVQAAPQPPAINKDKLKAVELMQQASALQKGEKLVEARAALAEAQKVNAFFSPEEDTPDMLLQSLAASAQKRANKLGNDASILMMRKTEADVASAEKLLLEAEDLVMGFGFDPYAVTNHRARLDSVRKEMVAAAKAANEPPPTETVKAPPEQPMGTRPPVSPTEVVKAPPEPASNIRPPVEATDPGAELLAQARLEAKNGQFETARILALQVLSTESKLKDQAQALIRTVHAEETGQKQKMTLLSYERGVDALQSKNYEQAMSIFKLLDASLLPPAKQRLLNDQMALAHRQIEKANAVAQVRNVEPKRVEPKRVEPAPVEPAPVEPKHVTAKAIERQPEPTVLEPLAQDRQGADSLVKQEEAMRELQFQKLRAEGLQLEASATSRFGKGETDAALADLQGFVARVKSSNIDPAKVALLTRPIENRIERLKVLEHQQKFLAKEAKDLRDFRNQMTQEQLHEQHKKQETAKLMKDFGRLMDEGKFEEAGKVAMQARQLDPDDPVTGAAMQISRMRYRQQKWEDIKDGKEKYNYDAGNDAHDFGDPVSSKEPIKFNPKEFNRIRNRASATGGYGSLRPLSENEKRIESKLNSLSVDLDFNNQPLEDVVRYLQTTTGLNFYVDTRALQEGGVDPKTSPVSAKLNSMPLRSALDYVLMSANLKYVIDRDAVRITTPKGARGKLVQRTIPVADLVVPVQNYTPSAVSSLDDQLARSMQNNRPMLPGSATTPFTPQMGLPNSTGTPTGQASLTNQPGGRGSLTNGPSSAGGSGVKISGAQGTIEESLIRLITSSVQPDTWEAMGGMGRIEYYPLGMALVINQTPDVIEEVGRLLEALRQLQDLEVAIEVRMITLAETFYERIGMDFSMNVNTHNTRAAQLIGASSLSNNNFTNIQNVGGKVVGLQTPGVPTPDLNLPIAPSSFGMAIPPFGNFPNAPGADGGLSLGLAFLNDIQVQMFLEAAQGDRRTNVMQAPKLTMFNGQSANIQIQDQQFFLTGITVTSVNGQLVFTPQNQPFPLGVTMNMQPVVTGDRRFVRLNIQQQMTNLASATVPLFPITTIVTPVFEGGAQGQPVPFTQYIQQPTFSSINVSTTVVVPDGGTVLLGGLKTLNEGRNEFGPPVLSKIPYVSRLFRNVGYGRDAQSLMMMVTPRIIINREEQEKQTGVVESQEQFGGGPQ